MEMTLAIPVLASSQTKTGAKGSTAKTNGAAAFGDFFEKAVGTGMTDEKNPVTDDNSGLVLLGGLLPFCQPSALFSSLENTESSSPGSPINTVEGTVAQLVKPVSPEQPLTDLPQMFTKQPDDSVLEAVIPQNTQVPYREMPNIPSLAVTPAAKGDTVTTPVETAPLEISRAFPLPVNGNTRQEVEQSSLSQISATIEKGNVSPQTPVLQIVANSDTVIPQPLRTSGVYKEEKHAAELPVLSEDNEAVTSLKTVAPLSDTSTQTEYFQSAEQQDVSGRLPEPGSNKTDAALPNISFEPLLQKHTPTVSNEAVVKQTEAQYQTPVADKYELTSQIVEQAKLINRPQASEMIVKLKPEHLGELTFKITVEQGVVSAAFVSSNAEVRGIIEASLPQLKQEFSSQGIKLDNVGVFAGMEQFLSGDQRGQQQYQQPVIKLSRNPEGEFAEIANETPGSSTQKGMDTAVDYRV